MKRIFLFSLPVFLASAIPSAVLAQNIAPGEDDYLRKTDVDYDVFDKDEPINGEGLFEIDKNTGEQTDISKTFKQGADIYQQAKPVLDIVGGIFGADFSFLDHIDKNLVYGEWLFGKVSRDQVEQGGLINGTSADGQYGVDGRLDPSKVRERALSTIDADADIKIDSPFGISPTIYKTLVGGLALTRAARQDLEVLFGEQGQQFAKQSRDYTAGTVKSSASMAESAVEAKSTQDVNKLTAQIQANGQLLDQAAITEQQQTRLSVDRLHDTSLTQLEMNQQEKLNKELKERSKDFGVAQVRQLAFSLVNPSDPSVQPRKVPQVAAQQNPSFLRNRK